MTDSIKEKRAKTIKKVKAWEDWPRHKPFVDGNESPEAKRASLLRREAERVGSPERQLSQMGKKGITRHQITAKQAAGASRFKRQFGKGVASGMGIPTRRERKMF